MSAFVRLSRLAIIPTAPIVLAQGRHVRRTVPRLPDAAQPWTGVVDGPDALQLIVMGDSTAAGVGATTQDEALPGQLGRELQRVTGRGVRWRAVGENGVDAREFIDRYLDDALDQAWDVVFISLGVNDAMGLRSRRAFARDIRTILERVTDALPRARILVASLPAFPRFTTLPQPLRANLALHARNLEAGARAVVAQFPNAHMAPPPPPYTPGFFATDNFHPSAQGYRDWAEFAIADAISASALPES